MKVEYYRCAAHHADLGGYCGMLWAKRGEKWRCLIDPFGYRYRVSEHGRWRSYGPIQKVHRLQAGKLLAAATKKGYM